MTDPGLAPPVSRPRSLTLSGVVTGGAVMLAVFGVYQLIRVGFHVAVGQTAGGAPDPADRVFGVYIVGGLLSLGPAVAAGALTGGLVAEVLGRTWRRQGPIRAWLTGSLVAYAVAAIASAVVLSRQRDAAMTETRWLHLLGYPSLVFVIVFGIVGLWLYLSRTWTVTD